ncbi:f-box domain-containing protein [Apiospora hydei]|uniref:F-box domain-containing protein n=1 Tax=Apiospora hydei TaxID=1337664 RepID=A0ABR1W8E2_9PEZI
MLTHSDRDFDPRGPTGPTAFWKISERSSGHAAKQRDLLYPGGVFTDNPNYDPDYESADDLDAGSEDGSDDDDEEEEEDEVNIEIELLVGVVSRLQMLSLHYKMEHDKASGAMDLKLMAIITNRLYFNV